MPTLEKWNFVISQVCLAKTPSSLEPKLLFQAGLTSTIYLYKESSSTPRSIYLHVNHPPAFNIMLTAVTVVVKFQTSRSRTWKYDFGISLSKATVVRGWRGAEGGAVSRPEAPLPVIVGRHSIHSCNLFVALWGAHLMLFSGAHL